MPTLNYNDSFDIQYALKTLNDAHLLNDMHRQLIEHSSAPFDLANILIELDSASLLNEANISALANVSELYYFSEILYYLNQTQILDENYFQKLVTVQDLMHFSHIIGLLSMFNLLTHDNLNKIINHDQYNFISYVMGELNKAQILNQPNFDAILDPQHSALFSTQAMHLIFDHLPQHLLAANWRHILEILRLENPINRLEQFVNLILGFFHLEDEANELNPIQSTHTASVHQSVSESAIKLMNRYQNKSSENLMKNFIEYLKNHHNDNIKYKTAQNCLARLTSPNFEFIDPVSQVSIQKLILLSLHAILDEQSRIGTYHEALEQLIEGFYEIQRGYNLNDKSVDIGGDDLPICKAGSFNKIIEKLQAIHPDCQVIYLSHELASLKLPIVVREEVNLYLTSFSSPKNMLALMSFTKLLNDLQIDGLELIWPSVRDSISLRISEEFLSLFTKLTAFNEFIDYGKETQLNDLEQFQQPISNSKGYKKFCYASMHQLGFFKVQYMHSIPSLIEDNKIFLWF